MKLYSTWMVCKAIKQSTDNLLWIYYKGYFKLGFKANKEELINFGEFNTFGSMGETEILDSKQGG